MIVLGADGQVGRNVVRLCSERGIPCRAYGRAELDITDAYALRDALHDTSIVINCAAYTAVDRAESERATAFEINAAAPGLIADLCLQRNITLLHISTDYVFGGSSPGHPWREDDPLHPENAYAGSKAAGETAIRDTMTQHLILRTSWVFDAEGNNFVRTMMRLGAEREELAIVADQHGGPTAAKDIAAALLHMAQTASQSGFSGWGTYHFSGAPATTWFGFAEAIFHGRPSPRLIPITTAQYPTPARRPGWSVLDCGKIKMVFGIKQPDWRMSLQTILRTPAT